MARKISQSSKKKAPAKRTVTKSSSRKVAPSSAAYKKESSIRNSGVSAIIAFSIGALCCLAMWTNWVGPFGEGIRTGFLTVFGTPSYVYPLFLLGLGIVIGRKKSMGMYAPKYLWLIALLAMISAFWHTCAWNSYSVYSIVEIAQAGEGGGFLGAMIAKPLVLFMWPIGAGIIIFALAAILITTVYNINWVDLFEYIVSFIKERRERMAERYEYIEPEEIDKSKKDKLKKMNREQEERLPLFNKKEKKKDWAVEVKEMSEPVLPKKVTATVVPYVPESMPWQAEYNPQAEVAVLEKEIEKAKPKIEYILPPLSMLNPPDISKISEQEKVLESTAKKLLDTLDSFGVGAKITDYSLGPSVTRYELKPDRGVKISKILGLSDDIALNLAAKGVRIEAPIPGKDAIGIEIPNKVSRIVNGSEIIGSHEFQNSNSKVTFALGLDIGGHPIICDIARMPHLLVAGATGSGKSVCINTIIASVLFKSTPEEVRLILIDPKQVELIGYNGIPHLLIPVVTDANKAAGALNWAVKEMTKRYKIFAENEVRDLRGYNAKMEKRGEEKLPQVVIIIDELADLMMVAPNDVEDSICRLSQLARGAGMHLIVSTQSPRVDVITGLIKANIPSRIAFAVSSQMDSRVVLDTNGAEKLIGFGDMLYNPIGANKPLRVQGAFLSDKEIREIVKYAKQFNDEYDDEVQAEVNSYELTGKKGGKADDDGEDDGKRDKDLARAIEIALDAGQASVSMYQRLLGAGYQRAAKIIDQMEKLGVIGPFEGTKPRQVIITRSQYMEMLNNGII
ncbi:MAG: DNA translocase FtsK [Oscillospiraceae bacterium]|nr:DNA translocase FtsK [Oscillospiraceae bacterium]